MHQSVTTHLDCGLYYKHVTVVIYDCSSSALYCKHVAIINYASISIAFAIEQ
jgi:hypothetical protein